MVRLWMTGFMAIFITVKWICLLKKRFHYWFIITFSYKSTPGNTGDMNGYGKARERQHLWHLQAVKVIVAAFDYL